MLRRSILMMDVMVLEEIRIRVRLIEVLRTDVVRIEVLMIDRRIREVLVRAVETVVIQPITVLN